MGLYDDLRLEEEEEKFGLANDDNDGTDDSDAESEGTPSYISPQGTSHFATDPPQRSSKKHDKDEESVASGSRRDDSPIQKKPTVGLQLRSKFRVTCMCPSLTHTSEPSLATERMSSLSLAFVSHIKVSIQRNHHQIQTLRNSQCLAY